MPHTRPHRTAALARATVLAGVTGLLATGCGTPQIGDIASSSPSGNPASYDPSVAPASATTTASATVSVTPTATAKATGGASADATLPGTAQGVFMPYRPGATAVTYEPAVVPAGASATVTRVPAGEGTDIRLTVTGMIPRRGYGAHLHSEPCGRTPELAGPHYQHNPDPKAVASPPSVDPRYANPRNEVWLDFTADGHGSATVRASVRWPFDSVSPPRSLVVHAERTRTQAGKAGTAGPRAACLTLPL